MSSVSRHSPGGGEAAASSDAGGPSGVWKFLVLWSRPSPEDSFPGRSASEVMTGSMGLEMEGFGSMTKRFPAEPAPSAHPLSRDRHENNLHAQDGVASRLAEIVGHGFRPS